MLKEPAILKRDHPLVEMGITNREGTLGTSVGIFFGFKRGLFHAKLSISSLAGPPHRGLPRGYASGGHQEKDICTFLGAST